MSATRRRWFSFSLRTLFVATTIFAVWLGWNLSIVRERRQLLTLFDHAQTINGMEVTAAMRLVDDQTTPAAEIAEKQRLGPGVIRRWMGDEAYSGFAPPLPGTVWGIVLNSKPPGPDERGKLKGLILSAAAPFQKAFPEATIVFPLQHGGLKLEELEEWLDIVCRADRLGDDYPEANEQELPERGN